MDQKIDTFYSLWRWVGGRIYLYFFKKNFVIFFVHFFFMCLAIRGNDYFFFQYQQAKNRIRTAKIDQKIDTFCQVDTRDLAILWVKKIVFWTFSKLFRKCLGIIFGLTRPTFGCILSSKG